MNHAMKKALADMLNTIGGTLEQAWEDCPNDYVVEQQQQAWSEICRLAEMAYKKEKHAKLGGLIMDALNCRGYVSIELYDDKYHASVGSMYADEGSAKTPVKALEKAFGN